ncbi:PhnD/SsuA/transferrin family substrate-binding protein [Sulfuricurvum sp.]|uniref:PhnD/SsuA/transferrin family substrate-binding protein n=1 Tax=Sulfuricurvum sp. TaxID=2025608 RepID=UPI002D49FF79|nr:PhnD/SsuA/transferrin family substrate-binding protein [Sulfuricurvum sp.]HZF71206.1 PhnD/SsuA/transferrin family substrate-binding protein [Sulfuricurvum sp.]
MQKWVISLLAMILASSLYAEKITAGLYDPVLSSRVSKKDYVIGMDVFLKEIVRNEGIDAETISYDDPVKLSHDFESGKLNMIVCDPLTIVENVPFNYLQSGIMGYKYNQTDSMTLLVLVNADDTRPLSEQLHGSIAMDGDTGAELFLKTLMLQNGITQTPNLIATKNPQQSILKLFFHKADLTLIDRGSFLTAVELNPQIKTKTKILQSIPLTLGSVSYMRKGMSKELQQKIFALGKRMNTTPRGKQLLALFHGNYMDECDPKDLASVYALKKEYETLHNAKSLHRNNR